MYYILLETTLNSCDLKIKQNLIANVVTVVTVRGLSIWKGIYLLDMNLY